MNCDFVQNTTINMNDNQDIIENVSGPNSTNFMQNQNPDEECLIM